MVSKCIARAPLLLAVAALVFQSTSVLAHSWIDCVKYDPINEQCLGYPRGYPTRQAADINTAYTYLFSAQPTTQAMCNPKQQSTPNYAANLPMATAQPGETIYTTWEQNGHMNNASPTKVYILYYADSTKEFATVSERTTAPVAGSFNFATTANCYTSQPNSVCLGQWVIPKNLVPGSTYHFVWFWYFNQNPAGEWYSTCFDVNIQDKSHVVDTADMATLLQKGDPPDSYAYGTNSVVESLIAQVTTLPENVAAPSSTPKSTSSSTSSSTSLSPTQTPMVAATTTAADKAESDVIPASTAAALGRELYVSESSLPAYTKKCRQRPLKRT